MLKITDVDLAAGSKDLLTAASLHVHPGERIGLVGRNGAGKSTLIRALMEDGFERGTRDLRRGLQLGYLPQHAVAASEEPVWDEVEAGMVRIKALQERLDRCQGAVERGEQGAIEALTEAETAFSLAGGYAGEQRVARQ